MSGDSLGTKGYIDGGNGTVIPPAPTPDLDKNRFYAAEKMVNRNRKQVDLIEIELFIDGTSRLLSATPDSTVFKYTNRRGIMVRTEVRDFIIEIEDYRVLATAKEPKEGDLIEETMGSLMHRYEVLSVNNEPVFILTGAYRTAYRVHTKLIKEVSI